MSEKTPTFQDLGIDPALADTLADEGITAPFPIQTQAIPVALQGADVIGQARTGTGKTLAFGLPLLQRLDSDASGVQALIVTPTRELCLQVADDLSSVGAALGLEVLEIYGGVDLDPQTRALERGVHVVVGTPGRLLDQLGRGNLVLSGVRELVLDEADRMLDMGFLPDVERLIRACGEDRHTMLFSATMPSAIVSLGRRYMSQPTFIRAATDEIDGNPSIDQHFFLVHRMDKPRIVARILQAPQRGNVYVFTRTKRMADRLVDELGDLGVKAIAVHGDLSQNMRERNMGKFRDSDLGVLVATEVAARGLDVDNVTHVLNYDCPDDEQMYLHRIGRTARAAGEGIAITFATAEEVDRLNMIRRAVDQEDEPLPEIFSTSDELTEMFGLPSDTPWDHLGGSGNGQRSGNGDGRRSGRRGSGRGSSRSGSNRGSGRGGSGDDSGRGRKRARSASQDSSGAGGARSPSRRRTRTSGGDTDGGADRSIDKGRGEPQRKRVRRRGQPDGGGSTARQADGGDGDGGDGGRATGGKTSHRVRARDTGSRGGESGAGDAADGADGGDRTQRARTRRRSRPASETRSAPSGDTRPRKGGTGDRGPDRRASRSARADAAPAQVPWPRRAAGQNDTPAGTPARGAGVPRTVRPVNIDHLP